jgi:TolB-like protein/Flp pilus assembly protein TadD
MQRSENSVRITAQLVDALSGRHIWAERYDRELKDIFALQDDVAQSVVTALEVKLTEGEQARLWRGQTANTEAYEYFVRGGDLFRRLTKADNAESRRLMENALALDPGFAAAWIGVARTLQLDAQFGWTTDRRQSIIGARKYLQKSLALDDTQAEPYAAMSRLALIAKQHDQALALCNKAFSLNPGSLALATCGLSLMFLGRPEEALEAVNRAMRLSPNFPPFYLFILGNAHRLLGQYEEAIDALERQAEILPPQSPLAHLNLAHIYMQAGRKKDARAAAAEVLRRVPKFTLKRFKNSLQYQDPEETERILARMREAGLPENPPLKLPDKPSVAVLPFTNMSSDKDQEYFSDGITEDIITDLSKISGLFVVARNSSFKYKGKSVDVRDVGRDLGVQHVLEGSVRRSADQMRITVQLVDARSGNHIWAERYDRAAKDIFAIQDEIAAKVAAELAVTLKANEQERLFRWHMDNLEAYETFLRARRVLRPTRDRIRRAKRLFERVVELDPGFAGGYAGLSFGYAMAARHGFSASPKEDIERALEFGKRAVATDNTFGWSYLAVGNAYLMTRKHDKAIATMQEAVHIQPSDADAYEYLGFFLHWLGRGGEAVNAVKTAMRLNPTPRRSRQLSFLGQAYFTAGRYEDAIATFNQRYADFARRGTPPLSILAAAYAATGQDEKARAAMKTFLDKHPGRTIANYRHPRLYKRTENRDRLLSLLRKAGMPEG